MDEWIKILTTGLTDSGRAIVVAALWRLLVTLHIVWACGLLAAWGFTGFASAEEVKQLSETQHRLTVEILESRLFETREKQCKAQGEEARRFYGEKMQELVRRYRELTKQDYSMLRCEEL